MSENEISNFLRVVSKKIGSLHEAKRLYGSQIAPEFYIFDYLRDDEMGLSRFIGNLLNPKGKHGQGDVFLKQFLIQTNQLLLNANQELGLSNNEDNVQTNQWDFVSTENCEVKLEEGIDNQRRIDISLRFSHGEMIGIENKPWASDQKNQLHDYADYIHNKAGDKPWLLIYLCNEKPSEESISEKKRRNLEESGHLITMSYDELISWLLTCISYAKAPIVRTFIDELIKYIRKDINGEVDMSIAKEIEKIILKDEANFEAAMFVSKTLVDAKKDYLKDFHKKLEKATHKKGYTLKWKSSMDGKWSPTTGFGINFDSQQSYDFELWFEFGQPNLNAFHWGIRKQNDEVSSIKNKAHWKNINSLLSVTRFGKGNQREWWPWWLDYELDEDFKNWEVNVAPWNAIKNGELVQKVMDLSHEVYQYFEDKNSLDLLKKVSS